MVGQVIHSASQLSLGRVDSRPCSASGRVDSSANHYVGQVSYLARLGVGLSQEAMLAEQFPWPTSWLVELKPSAPTTVSIGSNVRRPSLAKSVSRLTAWLAE